MIVFKNEFHFVDISTVQYITEVSHDESLRAIGNMTGSDIPEEVMTGCVHTATLAVSTVLVIFVLFLGCTGNGMVLFTALTSKRLRNNFDLLVINLAGADFIMCTCLSPIFLFLLFSNPPFPKVFCGSILFLGTTSAILSLLSIVGIALHRQLRVVGRIKRPLSLTQTSSLVGFIWLVSLSLAGGGTFHVLSQWDNGAINTCKSIVNSNSPTTNNFVLFFIAPVTLVSIFVIAVSYGIIARTVRIQGTYELATHFSPNRTDLSDINSAGLTSYNQHNFSAVSERYGPLGVDTITDKANKAVTMCIVVSLTIILSWGPLITSQFIEIFTGQSIILYQVKLCGIALVFLNSALDPYLYGQTSGRIKHRYVRLLYNFARCEFSVERRSKIHASGQRILEACPPRSSHMTQDTNTVNALCENEQKTNYCAPHKGRKHRHYKCHRLGGPYMNCANEASHYKQNILLLPKIHENQNLTLTCLASNKALVNIVHQDCTKKEQFMHDHCASKALHSGKVKIER